MSDVVPQEGETRERYRARILNLRMNHVLWNEWVVDQKASELAVAHEGLRNALTATAGLIIVASIIAVTRLVS